MEVSSVVTIQRPDASAATTKARAITVPPVG